MGGRSGGYPAFGEDPEHPPVRVTCHTLVAFEQLGGRVRPDRPVTVVSLPARGRPPQAAARRAGLEFVEKLLPTKLTSTDTTERNAGMLRVASRSSNR
jgi:hypothetical protein